MQYNTINTNIKNILMIVFLDKFYHNSFLMCLNVLIHIVAFCLLKLNVNIKIQILYK